MRRNQNNLLVYLILLFQWYDNLKTSSRTSLLNDFNVSKLAVHAPPLLTDFNVLAHVIAALFCALCTCQRLERKRSAARLRSVGCPQPIFLGSLGCRLAVLLCFQTVADKVSFAVRATLKVQLAQEELSVECSTAVA